MESKYLNPSDAKAKHYIITHFCDEQYDWQTLLKSVYDTGRYQCVAGQLERGKKSGKVHIQVYLGLKTQTRGTTVIKEFPSDTWFKQPNKWQTDPANVGFRMFSYCTKEDTRICVSSIIFGQPPVQVDQVSNGKRGRCLQVERYEQMHECVVEGRLGDIPKDLYYKHFTTIKRVQNEVRRQSESERPFKFQFNKWESRIMQFIERPDDRTIVWCYDKCGGVGKSTFSKWLAQRPTTFYMGSGKSEDALFLIKESHTLLLVDLPRATKPDWVPYRLIETFKNGIWQTNKYEGNFVHRPDDVLATVIVFSNMLPNVLEFSKDKWFILELFKDDYNILTYDDLLYNSNEQFKV